MSNNHTQNRTTKDHFELFFSKLSNNLPSLFSCVASFILATLVVLFLIYNEVLAFYAAFAFFSVCIGIVFFRKFMKVSTQYFILFTNVSFAIFFFSSYCDFFTGIYLYNFSLALAIACAFNLRLKQERNQFIFHTILMIGLFSIDMATHHTLFKMVNYSVGQIKIFLTINIYMAFFSNLVFILLLLRLNRNQAQLQHQLSKEGLKSNQLELDNIKTKEILIAEIHHRVKNNLSLISSLLKFKMDDIQHKKYAHEETLHSIQTISLGNNQVYLEENSIVLNTNTYFNDLLFAWKELVPEEDAENSSYKLNIQNFAMNIRAAIPLGLIFHEFFVIFKELQEVKDNKDSQITIQLTLKEQEITLALQSNLFEEQHIKSDRLFLINTLVEQIDAYKTFDEEKRHYQIVLMNTRQQNLLESEQLF